MAKVEEIITKCKESKDKGLDHLMKVARRNGTIDFSQGDTNGIGVYSQNFDIMPFTQDFTLRASYFKLIFFIKTQEVYETTLHHKWHQWLRRVGTCTFN